VKHGGGFIDIACSKDSSPCASQNGSSTLAPFSTQLLSAPGSSRPTPFAVTWKTTEIGWRMLVAGKGLGEDVKKWRHGSPSRRRQGRKSREERVREKGKA